MRRISAQAGAAIRKSVNAELIDLSAARNVKTLTDHAYGYRLRVGNYRVFFDFMGGDVCIVSIEEVRKRDERTY
ncbi:MAG: type II toxin-antitoxin system RelE family toxin [Thiobacillus sp.]